MHHNQALQLDHTTTIRTVQQNQPYKFLGTKEHALQNSILMREETAKEFLQRAWLIWSSPLSDKHKVQATAPFALPALTYHMPIIHWPVNDLKELDRMLRKILNDTKAKHPASSNELLYFPRAKGGRGLKSVEQVYRDQDQNCPAYAPLNWAAAKADLIRMHKGRRSITRDANTFANEIRVEISTNQDGEWEIKFESQDKSTHLARGQTVKNVLTRAKDRSGRTQH